MTYTKGIDISHWNAWQDPQQAWNAGARFVIVRLGSINMVTGNCYTDYDLENNIALLKEFGQFGVAGYFYGRLNHDVYKQAQFIADMVDYCENDLGVKIGFIVWDQEEPGDAELLRIGMTEAEHRSGKVCNLYTSPYIWQSQIRGNKDWAIFFDLWIAQWTLANEPIELSPWMEAGMKWALWQYSAEGNGLGKVFGGAGYPYGDDDMDLNWFNGDYIQMLDYFNYATEPIEPPFLGVVKTDRPARHPAATLRGVPTWGAQNVIGQLTEGTVVNVIGEALAGNGEKFYQITAFVSADNIERVEE